MYFRHRYIFILLLLSLLSACTPSPDNSEEVIDGVIDLQTWNYSHDTYFPLEGQWEFYWKSLRKPEDFKQEAREDISYMLLPASWTHYRDTLGAPYPAYGYATYRLTMHLQESTNHPRLALFIPKIWSASRIWLNGELIYHTGRVSSSFKNYENRILEELVEIEPLGGKCELVVQVANFDMFIGGIPQPFYLGTFKGLSQVISLRYSWTLLWLGALLIMSIYHFILYFFRQKRKSTLYFGFIAILIGIRLIIFGDHYIYEYLKDHAVWFTFAVQSKIYYVTTFALVPAGLIYLRSLYPELDWRVREDSNFAGLSKFFNRWIRPYIIPTSVIITFIYSCFILVTPPRVYIPTILIYQGILAVFIVYMLSMIIWAALHKAKESSFLIIGILVMVIAGANDGLHQQGIVIFGAFELLPTAFAIFLSLQFVLIAKRFSRAFGEVEDLSENLEKKVIVRTAEVTQQKEEIEDKNKKLEETYKHIRDSVVYASRIQQAILGTPEEIINKIGNEAFIFYRPRDIVSGDFYWSAEIKACPLKKDDDTVAHWKGDQVKILVAADCTGHGVPGAFMTVMGNDFLNEIVLEAEIYNPQKILIELDKKVIANLSRQSKQMNDGMDLGVIALNVTKKEMIFSGAKNPLYFVRNGEIREIRGSKFPIGGLQYQVPKHYESEAIVLQSGDTFYLSSDGFQDQFGEAANRKYMKKRFRNYLHTISTLPMAEQAEKMKFEFESWKGKMLQTDDVLVVGVRV